MTPEADSLVGRWRAEHDWTATSGITAHVTVRTPFLGVAAAQAADVPAALRRLLPVPVSLARVEDRPGALVIVAEPDDALWELTHAASRAWPALGPHKDGRPDTAFHITVVRTEDRALRAVVARELAAALPLTVAGTELWVAERAPVGGAITAVLARA
jgi:hypothetical protein